MSKLFLIMSQDCIFYNQLFVKWLAKYANSSTQNYEK